MIGHREGPETCNTYNMLRLTEELFTAEPKAAYADFYERALYNHILASINPKQPGYVYFTPIRPDHYRVYSQPEQAFWCCVGTGMENPGRYGEFIYARAKDGLYVNLFIPSELSVPDDGMVLRQETKFPDEASTQLRLQLEKPATFTLNIRHPGWVNAGDFAVKVNGRSIAVESTPSSYAAIRREWKNGDTDRSGSSDAHHVERLPDGSDWVAIKHGPIVLASPRGAKDMPDLYADSSRMGHVASVRWCRWTRFPSFCPPPKTCRPCRSGPASRTAAFPPQGRDRTGRSEGGTAGTVLPSARTAISDVLATHGNCHPSRTGLPVLGKNPADGLEQLGLFRHHRHRGPGEGASRCHGEISEAVWLDIYYGGHPVVCAQVARTGYEGAPDWRWTSTAVLCPRPNRFPSSSGGKGFKPLADYVHAKGLKFGIHIMRGIPRQAVRDNTPILGTDARAADIANTRSICPWNPDM